MAVSRQLQSWSGRLDVQWSTCGCRADVSAVDVAVRQLSCCLERAEAELNRRSVELEDMTLEWRQFDETMAEFERWVSVVEDDCQSHAARAADAYTITDVAQLINDNHVSLHSRLSASFLSVFHSLLTDVVTLQDE